MKRKSILIIMSITLLINTFSLAHSGRTDAYGGHYNHSTGTYHYHSGSYSGEYTGPVEEGGVKIEDVEETEDIPKINMNDTSDINNIISDNNNLKKELESKRNSIVNMNNKINEQREEINELKNSKRWIHIVYLVIILIMLIYGYKHL